MGHKKSKGASKKSKSKNQRKKNCRENIYEKEEENSKKIGSEVYSQTISPDNLEVDASDNTDASDIHTDANTANIASETTSSDASNNADTNKYCEEIKAKQQEIFDKIKNLSEALSSITLIRDNVNSIRVDTLTELYFTRQVRPLLDALNIISFASTNMSATATAFQTNAFGDRKEIKEALKLSYKMNGEVDDIINSLGRRLTIFLKQIDNMDKNCPPFNSGKDS